MHRHSANPTKGLFSSPVGQVGDALVVGYWVRQRIKHLVCVHLAWDKKTSSTPSREDIKTQSYYVSGQISYSSMIPISNHKGLVVNCDDDTGLKIFQFHTSATLIHAYIRTENNSKQPEPCFRPRDITCRPVWAIGKFVAFKHL